MDYGGSMSAGREPSAESDFAAHVDDTGTAPVHFGPPVKEWIEYLAEVLAREVIHESEGSAA
jgi:hypothetical protein